MMSRMMSSRVMTATNVHLDSIPLVDVAPLMRPTGLDRATKLATLNELKSVTLENGFFTIPTAGVLPSGLLQRVYEHKDAFLALPEETKRKYHVKNVPNARGWTPMFEEPSYQPDVVSHLEGFDLARELPETYLNQGSLGPNVWPTELPGFQEDIYGLYEKTTELSTVLFTSFAEMLGLPPRTFSEHVSERAEAFMRLLTYPKTNARVEDSTVGISSHTDFECFTIIHQNGEGLHLCSRSGEWVAAPVCEDRLFILIGDMLERWTNGVLQATEHRVVNSSRKRQSIVRFNGVDGDTVVEPLASFVSASNPRRFDSITQREHIEQQINQAEEQLQQAKIKQHAG